jgi:hypothetical protein
LNDEQFNFYSYVNLFEKIDNNDYTRIIEIKVFGEVLKIKVNEKNYIGDFRKTIGCLMVINSFEVKLKNESALFEDGERLFILLIL